MFVDGGQVIISSDPLNPFALKLFKLPPSMMGVALKMQPKDMCRCEGDQGVLLVWSIQSRLCFIPKFLEDFCVEGFNLVLSCVHIEKGTSFASHFRCLVFPRAVTFAVPNLWTYFLVNSMALTMAATFWISRGWRRYRWRWSFSCVVF